VNLDRDRRDAFYLLGRLIAVEAFYRRSEGEPPPGDREHELKYSPWLIVQWIKREFEGGGLWNCSPTIFDEYFEIVERWDSENEPIRGSCVDIGVVAIARELERDFLERKNDESTIVRRDCRRPNDGDDESDRRRVGRRSGLLGKAFARLVRRRRR
jgi:hypothetical protein